MNANRLVRAFTLIELLVVIAVIGILASVVIANVSSARIKARDARRVGDLAAIQTALSLYYDKNNVYPADIANLAPDYTQSIPKDPLNIAGQYGYYYIRGYKPTGLNTYSDVRKDSDADQHYILAARLENSSTTPFSGWDNSQLNYLIGQ